jgi:hypothetical protein
VSALVAVRPSTDLRLSMPAVIDGGRDRAAWCFVEFSPSTSAIRTRATVSLPSLASHLVGSARPSKRRAGDRRSGSEAWLVGTSIRAGRNLD